MNEVKLYGSVLGVLLVAAYFSWTREEARPGAAADMATIVDAPKESLRTLAFYTKTQTVSISFRKGEEGKDYPWFEVEQAKKKRGFVGNDKVDKMLEGFAPFKALRSLGKLSAEELAEAKLDKPDRRLVLGLKGGEKEFELGGRTSGARDHYLRARGGSGEVFLVGSQVLGDLEFPEGRFMQRKLRDSALKDVGKVTIAANGKTKTILHKNRLSPNDSFWASEAKPDEKSETLGNYVDKLEKLSAVDYGTDEQPLPKEGTPVLVVTWYGEDETTQTGVTEIWRAGEDRAMEYYARSSSTHLPVKLSKFAADQIERDLATVLAD